MNKNEPASNSPNPKGCLELTKLIKCVPEKYLSKNKTQ